MGSQTISQVYGFQGEARLLLEMSNYPLIDPKSIHTIAKHVQYTRQEKKTF